MEQHGFSGAGTVNTVPDATLAAFRDHGEAADTLGSEAEQRVAQLAGVAALGIDLDPFQPVDRKRLVRHLIIGFARLVSCRS